MTEVLGSAEMLRRGSLSAWCCVRGEERGESSNVLFLSAKTGEGLCSIFSPSFVQWDAMTFFSESVISQMFRTLDKDVCVPDALTCSLASFGLTCVLFTCVVLENFVVTIHPHAKKKKQKRLFGDCFS